MRNVLKQDYRAAVEIAESLRVVHEPPSFSGFELSIDQCRRWQHRADIAATRSWFAASQDASARLRGALDLLQTRTTRLIDELNRQAQQLPSPSPAVIAGEIAGLRDEFEQVRVNCARKRLRVQTSSIVLEGVYLGPFEIRLDWQSIKRSSPYEVVALDANPPTSGDEVTHPHVQSEALCEGEGSDAIRRALDEGRLNDFFCIVDLILRTYNPDSAYVRLDEWGGVTCQACGDYMASDESSRCDWCDKELCLECLCRCESCADRFCTNCLSSCRECGEDCCEYCKRSCDQCSEKFCPSCLHQGICDACNEQEKQTKETTDSQVTEANPAVHAVCDGQAAVPA